MPSNETIENLQINISENSTDAAQSLDKLASSLERLKVASSGKNSLGRFSEQLKTFAAALNGIDTGKADALSKVSDAITKMSGARAFSKTITNNLNELNQALNAMSGTDSEGVLRNLKVALSGFEDIQISTAIPNRIGAMQERLAQFTDEQVARFERFAHSLASIQGMRLPRINNPAENAGDNTDQVQDMGFSDLEVKSARASVVFGGLSGVISALQAPALKTAQVLLNLGNTAGKAAKGFAGLLGRLVKLPIVMGSGFASKIKQVTSGLGNMFSALKRIAMYRLFRTAIKMFTEGLAEGTKHMYQYSQVAGTQFASSMDKIATAGNYVKNSLGSLAAPIINAIAPAIDFVADKVVDLINLIAQLFAKLAGKDTYSKAKKFASTWQDASDDASGAVKKATDEMKRYTLGFDELNILGKQDDDSGGRGGGGGGSGDDGSDMFEEVEIDNDISDFANKLKDAFANQDWKTLGETIGEKINEIVESIPWYDIGYQAGSIINAAVQTAVWTIETIDWRNIGNSLAQSINGMLEAIDWSFVGRLVTEPFRIAVQGIVGFIEGLDFGAVASALSNYIIGAFSNISDTLESINWYEFGQTLYQKIVDFITNIDFGGIVSSLLEAIGAVFGAGTALFMGIAQKFWEGLQSAWESTKDYFNSYIEEAGGNIIAGVFNGIVDALKSIGTWIKTNIWDPFIKGFKKAFGINSPSTKMEEQGGYIIAGLLQGIVNALVGIATWVEENILNPIISAIIGKDFDLSEWVSGIWDGIKNAWGNIKDKVVEFSAAVINEAKKWWKDVKGWWGKKVGQVKEFTTAAANGAKQWWKDVKGWWADKVGKVDEFTTNVKNQASTWWKNAKSWWADNIRGKSLKEIVTNVKNQASTWWSNVKEWWNNTTVGKKVNDFVAEVKNKASTWWSNVKTWWNNTTVGKKVNDFVAEVKNKASTWWSNVKTWWKEKTDGKSVADFIANVKKNAYQWWTDVRTAWNNKTDKVVSFAVNVINGAKDWWDNVKKWWADKVGTLWTTLSINLPKVKVTWVLDPVLKKVKIPSFKLEWNARGGILNGAQIFGMMGNTLLGGGEAGQEAVLPLDRNTGWMDEIAARVLVALEKAENLAPPMNTYDMSRNTDESMKRVESSIDVQNALLRRQNELLQAILQKDSSVEITANAMASAFGRKNQRDGKTIIPLGT